MITLNKNIVAFLNNLVIPPDDGMDNRIYVSTIQIELMQYGYILDEDAFIAISKTDLNWIVDFKNQLFFYLKNLLNKYDYKSLYKNFPQEVMSLSDNELFYNAIKHYWSNGIWEPTNFSFEKEVKFEKVKFTILKKGTEEDFENIFTKLVSINQSLMPQDTEIITWFVNSNSRIVMPDSIPFKENLCKLAAMGIKELPKLTTTDVLRIAVYLSGGDISLPAVPKEFIKSKYGGNSNNSKLRDTFKFKKFKRSERRYILDLLENTNCDVTEMSLKDQRWIRLSEILHVGEYKISHPKAFKAIDKIRNEKVVSWYGKVEAGFNISLEKGLQILSERPGEFVRKIDSLIRNAKGKDLELIMTSFKNVMSKASNKVLFELYSHFEKRKDPNNNRYIMIKGSRRPTQLPNLNALDKNLIESVHKSIFSTLKDKFSLLPSLGNCWIDPELKKIPLPSNMRSLDFTLKPTIRGTRIPLNNKDVKVIRPFIHWMDKIGNEDLDLSAIFVKNNNSNVLNYCNLRVGKSCHSGDVRYRYGACAEYIDIDIQNALDMGYKYVIITVNNFSNRPLNSVESMFGIMEREFPESNSNWLPDTLNNAVECKSPKRDTLLSIFDLETKEYIFLDVDGTDCINANSNVEEAKKLIDMYCKLPSVSVYDLCLLHVEARGKQVDITNNIDNYFKFEDFCNDYVKTGQLMM